MEKSLEKSSWKSSKNAWWVSVRNFCWNFFMDLSRDSSKLHGWRNVHKDFFRSLSRNTPRNSRCDSFRITPSFFTGISQAFPDAVVIALRSPPEIPGIFLAGITWGIRAGLHGGFQPRISAAISTEILQGVCRRFSISIRIEIPGKSLEEKRLKKSQQVLIEIHKEFLEEPLIFLYPFIREF